jgi:hypothetical protein
MKSIKTDQFQVVSVVINDFNNLLSDRCEVVTASSMFARGMMMSVFVAGT